MLSRQKEHTAISHQILMTTKIFPWVNSSGDAYYVQGDADEAVIRGLAGRWCPHVELAGGKFRGSSRESYRRELKKTLVDLYDDKECDILVVLTDGDNNRWQDVKREELQRIPEVYQHVTLLGVADRNVECWLAADRAALADELECDVDDIPHADPSGFVKRRFGLSNRVTKPEGKQRIIDYVRGASLRVWIHGSSSFSATEKYAVLRLNGGVSFLTNWNVEFGCSSSGMECPPSDSESAVAGSEEWSDWGTESRRSRKMEDRTGAGGRVGTARG